jgi:EAL domain-containing protein (putative c-di-GMP-specific phosphodiesterase class I)
MLSTQPPKLAMLLRDGVDVETEHVGDVLTKLLKTVRNHLGMEGAFVSRFHDGQRYFQAVDCNAECELPKGGSGPLEESYCMRVADGRLPQLIKNAQEVPAALELAATKDFPIGAHLSIPLRLTDGSIYGTFCCFSRKADYSLNGRDLELLRMFAEIATSLIERDVAEERSTKASRERVEQVLQSGEILSMVYQPIVELESQRIVGFESLARFRSTPPRPPDIWFQEAASVGLGQELEMLAIQSALAHGYLANGVYVACNASPAVVLSGELPAALCQGTLSRVVLEITEHSSVQDYKNLECVLRPLREKGLRLAVDDAGAGYSSFGHILRLHPDYIKLDMSITRGIDRDRGRRALTAALIGFAHETGSELIAEGVETMSELETLRSLGVPKGQGYLLGRPAPFDTARELVDRQLD